MCKGINTSSFIIEHQHFVKCPICKQTMTFKNINVDKNANQDLGNEVYCNNPICELYNLIYRANWPKVSLINTGRRED